MKRGQDPGLAAAPVRGARTFCRTTRATLRVGLLLAGAHDFARAQTFPPQGDDTTPAMGVFRIMVDPLFRPLLAPTGPPASLAVYLGYHNSDGHLTTPMLVDTSTTIGRSKSNARPTPFPQPLGAGSWDTLHGYADFPAIPSLWFSAPNGTDEVLSEIKSMVLTSTNGAGGVACPNAMVPTALTNNVIIKSGTAAGVNPRSPGLVQENGAPGPPDFPARGFFDVFVQVTLPPLPGTESAVAFPPGGAVLTNDGPLILTNLNESSLPSTGIYLHGANTTAVPLRFKFNNPPYWAAGDWFGTLDLAGFATVTNNCSQEAVLAAAVLGTPAAPAAELPTEWLRTNNLIPAPGSSFVSILWDANPPLVSDTLQFAVPYYGFVYVRDFVQSNLVNPISLPPPNTVATYYDPNLQLSFQFSVDQQTWYPAVASGPLTVAISNTANAGSPAIYSLQITSMNLSGSSAYGTFLLRNSASFPSTGMHTVRSDPRGYRVSSCFDVFTEFSTDGYTYYPADRSVRMQMSAPPPAPGSLFMSRLGAASVSLRWLGPFTLQSAASPAGPYSDAAGPTNNLVNGTNISIGPGRQYFRLRQ